MLQTTFQRRAAARLCAAASVLALSAGAAHAQEAAQASGQSVENTAVEEVVVTGYRAALQSAISIKRNANVMVDAINAEDIADFPDANLAESLQRLPGVSIDRENGEGRTITVRGLGSDFTRVRLNGLEALSTAAATDSGTSPNRSRGFDFNTFASELFNSLKVQKTASAETDEGSLGATVDLQTGRPFDFKGRRLALSIQDSYYENGGNHVPRIAGLVSDRWNDTKIGDLGALFSLAYNSRKQTIDSYQRQAGQSDLLYRNATHTGATTTATGFATVAEGSSADALAQMNDLTVIPALATLNHAELQQERIGATAAFQWRPTPKTTVTTDLVYSRLWQDQTNYQLQTVGLNRNNTKTVTSGGKTYSTYNASTAPASVQRQILPYCTSQTGTAYRDAIDCGTDLYGSSLVSGTSYSYNPNNLEPYDYYYKYGYNGQTGTAGVLGAIQALVGRPATQVLEAHVNDANQADYLVMDNVDVRSAADESYYTTTFQQASFNVAHEFSDRFTLNATYGLSRSRTQNTGLLVEFNHMDADGVVYDERGGGSMPILNFGFNVADPTQWDTVKGFSALRHYERYVDNRYETAKVDLKYDIDDDLTWSGGVARRVYQFTTAQYQRLSTETLNPTLLEAGTTTAAMSKLVNWGAGLDVSSGTPTSFIVPDIDKFRSLFGFDCNCVNKWGDWRLSSKSNPGNAYSVTETDTSFYNQFDFRSGLFDRTLRGNVGVRYALTELESNGYSTSARALTATNKYHDLLPSLNLAYELKDNMLLRFGAAKVMARPQLANLSPGISSLSTSLPSSSLPSITLGNPELKPFRATNYDLSFEWYFAPGALFSAAIFTKEISSFPQNVTRSGPLSQLLDSDSLASVKDALTNTALLAYIAADGDWTIRQYVDAPGGRISGVEFSYQQNLTFLPAPFDKLGVQANYTHLESKLGYILNPDKADGIVEGPWLGASPDAVNFTVYYDADKWSARLSSAYRAAYYTTYPLASGTCAPGDCSSPYVNDFGGSNATFNLDGSATYTVNKFITLNVEALNLTNQKTERWAYDANHLVTNYGSTGRSMSVGFRLKY